MSLLDKLRKIIRREKFDFDSHEIDLNMFHQQLRVSFVSMGIFFNNMDSILRFIWPMTAVLTTFVWLGMLLMFTLHGLTVKDFSFATECFCYLVTFGIVPFVYVSMIVNRKYVLQILNDMNNDFTDVCKIERHTHRKRFLDGQLLIWNLFYAWMIFTSLILIAFLSMAIIPLIYSSMFGFQDEHYTRPLVFPIWLPKDDPYRTPNYEIFLCMEVYLSTMYLLCFPVFVYIEFHILLHNCIKLDIIVLDIKAIFERLDASTATLPRHDERRVATQHTLNRRMGRIANQHISVFKSIATLSRIVGAPLAYQILTSSLCMCLIMYQIEVKLYNGVLDIRFVLLLLGDCMQLGILCFLGTMLQNKAFAVGDACWNCGWQESRLGQLLRLDMLIVMLRAQQPLTIKYTGLPQPSLETYSTIMSTSYSYFNMLRQYNQQFHDN